MSSCRGIYSWHHVMDFVHCWRPNDNLALLKSAWFWLCLLAVLIGNHSTSFFYRSTGTTGNKVHGESRWLIIWTYRFLQMKGLLFEHLISNQLNKKVLLIYIQFSTIPPSGKYARQSATDKVSLESPHTNIPSFSLSLAPSHKSENWILYISCLCVETYEK